MSIPIPSSKPKATLTQVMAAAKKQWQKHRKEEPFPELFLLAVRGYYRDSMGKPGENDLNQYDDAIFIVSPLGSSAWNANTDPTRYGWNSGAGKYMARLQTGVWNFVSLVHRKKYSAFGQGGNPVLVDRVKEDGSVKYFEKGCFGINLHKGGENGTSSEGCNTVPPGQWKAFQALLAHTMKVIPGEGVPYILTDEPIN